MPSDDPSSGHEPPQPPRPPRREGELGESVRGFSIGVQMVVCIGLGTAAGVWADRHIPGETPWGTLVGFGLGTAAAFRELMRFAGAPSPSRPRRPER